jgi:hypothetical protein
MTTTVTVPSTATALHLHTPGVLTEKLARKRFRLAWKAYLKNHPKSGAKAYLVYSLLLGKPLSAAFKPVSRPGKLANGRRPYDTLKRTADGLTWWVNANVFEETSWLKELGISESQAEALGQAALAVDEAELLAEFNRHHNAL